MGVFPDLDGSMLHFQLASTSISRFPLVRRCSPNFGLPFKSLIDEKKSSESNLALVKAECQSSDAKDGNLPSMTDQTTTRFVASSHRDNNIRPMDFRNTTLPRLWSTPGRLEMPPQDSLS